MVAKKCREMLPWCESNGRGGGMRCVLTELVGKKMAPGAEPEEQSGRHEKLKEGEEWR